MGEREVFHRPMIRSQSNGEPVPLDYVLHQCSQQPNPHIYSSVVQDSINGWYVFHFPSMEGYRGLELGVFLFPCEKLELPEVELFPSAKQVTCR